MAVIEHEYQMLTDMNITVEHSEHYGRKAATSNYKASFVKFDGESVNDGRLYYSTGGFTYIVSVDTICLC